MKTNRAVVVDPHLPTREVMMDEDYQRKALIGCESAEATVPGYFSLFKDEQFWEYRMKELGITEAFHPLLCMVYDEYYLQNQREVNKICSDIYSACRMKPWPILGVAIIENCSLKQLRFMYEHLPVYLASDPRIDNRYKQIILSPDASAYGTVLDNPEKYI